MQQKAVDLIEQAFAQFEHNTIDQPPPNQFSATQSIWQSWRELIDRAEAEYEGLRREVHEVREEQQETRDQLGVVQHDQHNQTLRLAALEAGNVSLAGGLSDQRLGYTGLADHFRVKNIYYLSDKDWPAVLLWFESLLEDW